MLPGQARSRMKHELWHRDGATDHDHFAWMIRSYRDGKTFTKDLGNLTETDARETLASLVARAHIPTRKEP